MIRGFWNWLCGRCWVVIAQNGAKIKEVHVFYRYDRAKAELQRMKRMYDEGQYFFCSRKFKN